MAVAITSGEETTVTAIAARFDLLKFARFSAEYWALFAFLLPTSLTIGIILKVHCSERSHGCWSRWLTTHQSLAAIGWPCAANGCFRDRRPCCLMTWQDRVLPLGSTGVNVRSGMPTAESRRSPFGQTQSFATAPTNDSFGAEDQPIP
jgi:hypothetical protein